MKGERHMKRFVSTVNVAAAALALAAAAGMVSCGTEEPGTNGNSEEYFPNSPGQRWVYDTYNLTRDPNRQIPFYTHLSVETVPAGGRGGIVEPTFVTKYAAADTGERFRLDQAYYWANKDIFFKYDYFNYGVDRFLWRGYHYMNEFRDPVVGTFFYNPNNQVVSFTLFKIPFVLNDTWDVLNASNPDPVNNPTVFRNIDQRDYFGLPRDMDDDGRIDNMDLSIVGRVTGRELIDTDFEQLNCWKIELTQSLVFHMSSLGDIPDVSTTTYWIAPYVGTAKYVQHNGSGYLDTIEMNLRTWWFVK